MQAAEEDFEAGGRKFRAGAFIIAGANRAALDPTMKALGIGGFSVAAAPTVPMHDLDIPRIGYVHSWANTQNEGWVRAALDSYRCSVHLFRRHQAARGQPAAEVRRHHLPARRRQRAGAGQRHPEDRVDAAAVQEDGGHAKPRRAGSGRRYSRRHGLGRVDGAREVRARRRHAHHRRIDVDDLPGVQHHHRRDGRESGRPVRSRFGHARRVRRSPEPDRVRLRCPAAGLLQPGAGAERGGGGGFGGFGGGGGDASPASA